MTMASRLLHLIVRIVHIAVGSVSFTLSIFHVNRMIALRGPDYAVFTSKLPVDGDVSFPNPYKGHMCNGINEPGIYIISVVRGASSIDKTYLPKGRYRCHIIIVKLGDKPSEGGTTLTMPRWSHNGGRVFGLEIARATHLDAFFYNST